MARVRVQRVPRHTPSPARPAITPEEATYVEEVSLTYEGMGFPRMAGRILGWLLICDPPHQSLAQLGEVLHASKGSISTMTQMLLRTGLIKRMSLPGERRDYVVLPVGFLTSITNAQTERSTMVRRMADRGLELLEDAPPERQARLREMRDVYAFFEREMPAMLIRLQRAMKRTSIEPESSGMHGHLSTHRPGRNKARK